MTVAPIGPALLTLDELSEDEQALLRELTSDLSAVTAANLRKQMYYEAEQRIRHAGIAIPPHVANQLRTVSGWAGTVVDVLEERLDWYGWTTGEDYGLQSIYDDNELEVESGDGHLDALIYGISFVRVGTGEADEPSPLVTVESPFHTTGIWDGRLRRLQAAVTFSEEPEGALSAWLDLPEESISLERASVGGPWQVIDRDMHRLGRVPVVPLRNRRRGSRRSGRSEITRTVRYLADAAVRTVLGMEGNREFYSIPQLILLGRGQDAFVDREGRPVPAWQVLAGHALAIGRDEDGELPTVDQLKVGSPEPFVALLRVLSQLLAAEAGMPVSYLGLMTDNPTSADAIRALEARLVKRAERRQTGFGRAWREVARLCLLIRDGEVPPDFASQVSVDWRDPSTPTRAASADEATKLVGAGVLPATSPVTYARLGIGPAEQRQLERDRRRAAGQGMLEALQAAAGAAGGVGGGPGGSPTP